MTFDQFEKRVEEAKTLVLQRQHHLAFIRHASGASKCEICVELTGAVEDREWHRFALPSEWLAAPDIVERAIEFANKQIIEIDKKLATFGVNEVA